MPKAGKITALAPWYGSNRTLGEHVGRLLAGCEWVGVPFAGGMSELTHIGARTMLVSDLHRHVINLARVVADPDLNARLRERLAATPFHPDALAAAQERCRIRDAGPTPLTPCLTWAVDYFVCAWMSRNGKAGTADEFAAGMSVRWTSTGGDSATRFRSATESLSQWQQVMRRCTFVCLDVSDFLTRVEDRPRHGLYLDPPWPDDGDGYRHTLGEERQRRLAADLLRFRDATIVVRFGDHPLIRELYPSDLWEWHELDGRTMTNATKAEVLLVRRPAAGTPDSAPAIAPDARS